MEEEKAKEEEVKGPEKKPKLRVGDIIPFKESVKDDIISTMKVLDQLSLDYTKLEDPFTLDQLKRDFNAHLQRFAVLYSKVKVFKSSNHTYLEEARKRIKSEALSQMVNRKIPITTAKELVYSDDYYMERLDLIEEIMKVFIRTELVYERYSQTLQCIIQSVSLLGKVMDRDTKIS